MTLHNMESEDTVFNGHLYSKTVICVVLTADGMKYIVIHPSFPSQYLHHSTAVCTFFIMYLHLAFLCMRALLDTLSSNVICVHAGVIGHLCA